MKILVTGGCGFIGSNVTRHFLEKGEEVVILDNLSRPNVYKNLFWLLEIKKNFKFFQSNIADTEAVKEAVKGVDVIFHFAAQVGVQASIDDPARDFVENIVGTFNVLEAARDAEGKPFVVFASTNKVYAKIHTPYGCSKKAAEQYVTDYYYTYNIPTVVLRMSCIYGNRQFGTEEQGWLAHFMVSHIKNQPITIFGDGTQVRDVLYIDDYVRLCEILIENKEKVKGEVFDVGGGIKNTISVGEAVKKIGNKKVSYADWRLGDQHTYISDLSKIEPFWKPGIGVDEGLGRLKKWAESLSSH